MADGRNGKLWQIHDLSGFDICSKARHSRILMLICIYRRGALKILKFQSCLCNQISLRFEKIVCVVHPILFTSTLPTSFVLSFGIWRRVSNQICIQAESDGCCCVFLIEQDAETALTQLPGGRELPDETCVDVSWICQKNKSIS